MPKDKKDKGGAPPYEEVDIEALKKLTQEAARAGYAWSDADQARRFPEFKPGLDYAIGNANQNLTGAVDPTVQGGLNSAGLGMVDLGGANEFEKARNLGQPILAQQQRDRNYFKTLLSQPATQPRGDLAGLDAKTLVESTVVGKGDQLNYDWRNFGAKLDQYGVQHQMANALGRSYGGLAGGVVQSGISSLNRPTNNSPYAATNYLDPNTYNYAPAGGYGNAGFSGNSAYNYAPSNYGGAFEGYINNQPVYRATPVDSSSTGGGGF